MSDSPIPAIPSPQKPANKAIKSQHYPRHGFLRALRIILLSFWAVLGWYFTNIAWTLVQLAHTGPSAFSNPGSVADALVLPWPIAQSNTPGWVNLVIALVFLITLAGCIWALVDVRRERKAARIEAASQRKNRLTLYLWLLFIVLGILLAASLRTITSTTVLSKPPGGANTSSSSFLSHLQIATISALVAVGILFITGMALIRKTRLNKTSQASVNSEPSIPPARRPSSNPKRRRTSAEKQFLIASGSPDITLTHQTQTLATKSSSAVRESVRQEKQMSNEATVEFLLHLLEEEWTQARQSENQRAIMTNLLIIIASAAIGFLTQKGFIEQSLPLTFLLIIIGIFGMLASAKLYERHQFHTKRAQSWRKLLYNFSPNIPFDQIREAAIHQHKTEFRLLSKVPLHHVWLGLHLMIAAVGVICTLIILVQSHP